MNKIRCVSLALILMAGAFLILPEHSFAARASAHASFQKAYNSYRKLIKNPRKRKFRHFWENAIKGFDGVITKYHGTEYAAKAMLAKADAWSGLYRISRNQDDLDAAIESYEQLAAMYPKTKDAASAKARLKALTGIDPDTVSRKERPAVKRPDAPLFSQNSGVERKPAAPEKEEDARINSGLVEVRDIRHWSNSGYTRVVLDMAGPVKLRTAKLRHPDRLVFDLKAARLIAPLKRTEDVRDGILKCIRASQYNSNTVRIVLDLESLAQYKILMLPNPQRLVIDVSGSKAIARRWHGPGRLITIRSAINTSNTPPLALNPHSLKPAEEQAAPQAATKTAAPPAAQQAGTEEISHQPVTAKNMKAFCIGTIVIDPGHGGKDTGAIGKDGLLEKDVVLDIGLKLRDIIRRELGCKVVMTRDKDVFIDLSARPGVAIKNDADLFISIHANASLDRSAHGIETYLLNTTKDRNIMKLAAMENAMTIDQVKDFGLLSVVNKIQKDLVLDYKREESLRLAHDIQADLIQDLHRRSRFVSDKGVKQGPFLVLYGAEMPSILTEVGFISNPEEEEMLASPAYRQHIAEAIFDGIKDYIAGMKVTATAAKAN